MSRHNDDLYIQHITQAIAKIIQRLRGVDRAQFDENDLLQDGIIRQMEIMGEASSRLSVAFRDTSNNRLA
ncbi:MAG: hypothetical protein C7B46_03005 [Sulfobacillus benefaciens]|uniref:DUF86 domain-containing protein n=1 Tax=Sulfobacillus benefaciens TaxID=453960 RepID=A0A2T2XK74_9FIRM|nr:MAG: hypothetical protein C7B46_03005 [Sulfobacillus benefaciens]